MDRTPTPLRRAKTLATLTAAAAVATLAALGGCVERKITIASDPPGALVYLNDVEVGRSPVTVPFLWYGDYDVRMRLERTEGTGAAAKPVEYYLHTHRMATAPPSEWMGIDLFTELLPIEFKDEKLWAFDLPRVPERTDAELITAAKALKAQLETPTPLRRAPATQPATRPATSAPTPPATQPQPINKS